MIRVRYVKQGQPEVVLEIPERRDPLEVVQHIERMLGHSISAEGEARFREVLARKEASSDAPGD